MLPSSALRNRREGGVGVEVAAAGTVFQLQDVVINRRRIHFLVRTLLEVARVTAGAVRLIRSKPPGNDLVVTRMAGATKRTGSMRFVESALMRIGRDRRPGYPSAVTGIARLRGDEVARGFTCRCRSVMARRTASRRHARMAERRRDPGRGPVAGVAGLRRRHVRGGLPTRGTAVMARRTAARRHPRMAERRRDPGRGPVAGVAGLCG